MKVQANFRYNDNTYFLQPVNRPSVENYAIEIATDLAKMDIAWLILQDETCLIIGKDIIKSLVFHIKPVR